MNLGVQVEHEQGGWHGGALVVCLVAALTSIPDRTKAQQLQKTDSRRLMFDTAGKRMSDDASGC